MKSYLAPAATVLFRALVEAGPTAGLFFVEPTGEVVADWLCRYARLTPPQLWRADGVASIYSVCLVGGIPGGSPIRCGCGTSRRLTQLPTEYRCGALHASLNRTECVLS